MKLNLKIFILAFAGFIFLGCQSKTSPKQEPQSPNTENILPDFKMNHIGGGSISVRDEISKHKITVIDFWASWFGPCMQEAPYMVDLYNKYSDKGLGIIGISLDKDEQSWKNAVKRMHMNWTHISDLQGWNNAAAQMLGITSIPFTIVVNREGAILTAGLRGEELATFVASKLQ